MPWRSELVRIGETWEKAWDIPETGCTKSFELMDIG